jgi:hypothetical protein
MFLQCLEWLQPVQVVLPGYLGPTLADLTSSVGLRAPGDDFLASGPLWLLARRSHAF